MFDPKHINDIVRNLLESIPPGIKSLPQDIEKNFKSILEHSFNEMNLVTREEFEVQTKVLARTRAKLEALEKQLNDLENKK